MKGLRFFLWGLLVLIVLFGGLYLARLPLAGAALRAAMNSAGIERPQARVTALTLSKMEAVNLSGGPTDDEQFSLERLAVAFDWRRLLAERRINSFSAGPGAISVAIGEDGDVKLAGMRLRDGSSEQGGSLPFDNLKVEEISLRIITPTGVAAGSLSGAFDPGKGGAGRLQLEGDGGGVNGLAARAASLDAALNLDAAGQVRFDATFQGDLIAPQLSINNADFTLDGSVSSWRAALQEGLSALSGRARLHLNRAQISVADNQALADILSNYGELVFGAAVSTIAMEGALSFNFDNGVVAVRADGAPFTATTDTGASFVLSANGDTPLFRRAADGLSEAGFDLSFRGAAAAFQAKVDAEETIMGDWLVRAPVRIGDYDGPALRLTEASAVFEGKISAARLDGALTAASHLHKASIGRLSIADAPFSTRFDAAAIWAEQRAQLVIPADACAALTRARLALAQQDTEAVLRGARLCGRADPFMTINWGDAPHVRFSGMIEAEQLRYRLGKTKLSGRPPAIDFSGAYLPNDHVTEIDGVVKGGSMTLNEMLIFGASDARFAFALDEKTMRADSEITAIRITQNEEAVRIAPVVASGRAALSDEKVNFSYALNTPDGDRLGTGEGQHNVATAHGQSQFIFDRINFTRGGVQPDRLAPVLKGFIGLTAGAATGSAAFSWAPAGVSSSAAFEFDDITFRGPTRVVSRTIGLNGAIAFKSLWPIATDGMQTLTVDGVDLDALQLENGTIRFDLPGDESVVIEEAVFPWFGGELGVYGARASLDGGEATAPLRAENVDLAQILDYADVNGLSGEGLLSGVLPLIVEEGKARIEGGALSSQGPGVVRYQGQAAAQAAAAGGDQAQIAFDILRDLRYSSLNVAINGPLDGRLNFKLEFEGDGEVALNRQNVRVPVIYRINLDAALLELLNQANMSRNIQLQIERGLQGGNKAQ